MLATLRTSNYNLYMEKEFYDLGIIGGGPGGYAAAIRGAQKGLSVVLFEKDCVGGVCLNRGCIPTKTIIHCTDFFKSLKKADKFGISITDASYDYEKIFERKNNITQKIQTSLRKLIQSHCVKIIDAEAKIIAQNTISCDKDVFECKNVIIATGAKPASIKGFETDGDFIINSDQLLNMPALPQNIVIIGSGAIGIEWARILSALNKTVTVIEIAKNLLPIADKDISARIERLFKKDKIKFYKETAAEKIENNKVFLNNGVEIDADIVLCAAGRTPVLPPSDINLKMNEKFIAIDEDFKTNFDNIYAIGDVNGKIQLAHAATHQALGVIDHITENISCNFKSANIPCVIYGSPEIAWVAKTEQSLEGCEYKVSCFPVAALGKAQADDEIDGFIKVLSIKNKIVGAHIVSPEASALIQQFALMIDNELDLDKILKTTFAHPTYSEGVFEALLGLNNLSLSLLKVK